MKSNYYVYAYLDQRKPGIYVFGEYTFDFEPFYIGKAERPQRMYDHIYEAQHNFLTGNQHKLNKIRQIISECNTNPLIIKIKENLLKEDVDKLEKLLISLIGRRDIQTGILTNMTDGGDGVKGFPMTDIEKHKRSIALKGRKKPAGFGAKIAEINRHRKFSKETREKISASNKGKQTWLNRKHSEETKLKISLKNTGKIPWNKNKKLELKYCKLVSGKNNPMYGRNLSVSHREAISKANKGKKFSIETINKRIETRRKNKLEKLNILT